MTARPPRLRGFRVTGLLGAGGQATVWRAVPRGGGEPVALKQVLVRLADRLPEAEALNALDHPNLIAVRAVHRFKTSSVLVLDLAEGGTLAGLLARRRALPPSEVIGALTPIASALAAVHAAGLVHGDVTTANILFSADGLPVLADLGSAYWLEDLARALPADPFDERMFISGHSGDVYSLAHVARAALGVADLAEFGRLGEVLADALTPDPARRPTMARFGAELRFAGDASAVELHAGRHTVLDAKAPITRGARLPGAARATEPGRRSLSRRPHRWRREPRDTHRPRPSR